MKIIKDKHNNILACLYGYKDYNTNVSKFLTDNNDTLQVGSLYFASGSSAKPHIHKPKDIGTVYPVHEIIFVLSGEAIADIYDEDKELVSSFQILAGDLLITKRGGHGYHFNEDTRLLDIRAGKYIDKAHDKEMINE